MGITTTLDPGFADGRLRVEVIPFDHAEISQFPGSQGAHLIGKIAHFGRHGGHACQGRLGAQSTIDGLTEMFSKRLVIAQAMEA